MKKIIYLLGFIILFSYISFTFASCSYNEGSNIGTNLNNCFNDTELLNPNGSLDLANSNFSDKVYNITYTIAKILSIAAIFGIVYGSFLMVISVGEEEKIKKGKDVIKWSIIGFLGVVLASSIITLLITFFYELGADR